MLFLDLDGTLLDDKKRHYATYLDVLGLPEVRGMPIPEAEYWGHRLEGKPIDELLKKSRLFPTKYQLFKDRFDERLETPEMLGLDTLRVGVETSLGKLYTKTPIVLVTQRRDAEALESQVASIGIKKYFVTILAGAPPKERRVTADGRWKHKAQLIRLRYKILPVGAMYLGDTENDVKAAKSVGFEVYLVEGGHRNRDLQIKADPDRLVPDLAGSLKYLLPAGRWQR